MLNIYGSPLSSPTNKVRYVANFLGLNTEFHPVNLGAGEQRSPEYLKINPLAKVPAIEDEGFTLAESNAIIRYMANKCNSTLYPTDLKQRAIVDEWIDYASQHIAIPLAKIMFNTYFYKLSNTEVDTRSLEDGRNFINKNLPNVEQQLAKNKYIAGDTLSLADFTLLASLDVCELCQVDLNNYPSTHKWRKQLMTESFYCNCHESYTSMFNSFLSKIKA